VKRVISYSLFWAGKDEHALLYCNGLRAICRAHHTLFPDWEWRIYHDSTISKCPVASVLLKYAEAGLVNLVRMGGQKEICRAMIQRMKPAWESGVEITLCRDLDSLPTPREAMAVRQFVESEAGMHCITDHPQHGIPIMGGLCGFRSQILRNLTQLGSYEALIAGEPLARQGDDQRLLMKKVWPMMRNSMCEHRFSGFEPSPHAIKSYTSPSPLDLPWVPCGVLEGGDALLPFMGAPGFDTQTAVDFYNKNAPSEVVERISKSELA